MDSRVGRDALKVVLRLKVVRKRESYPSIFPDFVTF
jgi:hypothetical protein